MYESRKPVWALVSLLLFGLTVGVAHADVGSTDVMSPDPLDQPMTESLVADFASDSIATADTESLESTVSPDCASDTALTSVLGTETVLSANVAPSTWTCGPCSISACRNLPVGTRCGFNRWCVVSISCQTVPLTEKCVCGTDHF